MGYPTLAADPYQPPNMAGVFEDVYNDSFMLDAVCQQAGSNPARDGLHLRGLLQHAVLDSRVVRLL